jgi:hypothetical protein
LLTDIRNLSTSDLANVPCKNGNFAVVDFAGTEIKLDKASPPNSSVAQVGCREEDNR